MKFFIVPTIIAIVVCILTFLFKEDDDGSNREPNYLVTFLVTFCVVAVIAYVFAGDEGHAKSGGGLGSLKAVMREINVGDPDF